MPRSDTGRKRCAIYTRKSSEEGLEQEFNSLAAQRKACEAYIRSQQHEGWVLARTRYDDGGFSGGNMERPALQSLLADIRAGRIDTVVVYKVDRLTRSLADFARLVEIFDAQGASFVSVTQQFNTTSSMGRLTLNVLLSFAQFEREVTGERIRDKIAASKKKGMWMGGNVPLGYDANERTLVINPTEGDTVRRIFALYRELGCVRRVKEEADRLGLRTKCSTMANGTERGGKTFSRGHLYTLLSNPIYTGQIAHNGQLYPGQHPALIEDETWSAVRNQLAGNARDHRRKTKAAEPSLLAGLLVDARGERLTPSHAVKKGRRYRYYVSAALITDAGTDRPQGWRLAAREIEDAVIGILADALTSPASLVERIAAAGMRSDQLRKLIGRAGHMAAALGGSPGERVKLVRELVEKIIVDEKILTIKLRRGLLGGDVPSSASEAASDSTVELTAAVAFKHRGIETRLVLPGLATGETLGQTVDLTRWKKGIEALKDYDRLESEVSAAESISAEVRKAIREVVFPAIPHAAQALKDAGVWRLTPNEVEQTQRDVLMNGLVEGCDGNVHVMNTMAIQIVQIAVVAVSYRSEEESWAHRIFKRDIRVQADSDMVEETLKLLRRRSPDQDGADKPKKITDMMRRGVMTFMERQILADALKAPWRIGHGNLLAYELLTGAGSAELIRLSVPVLRSVIEHGKFLYVSSDTSEQHIKTIGDALYPLEYAIISDARPYLDRISRGHFRGEWAGMMSSELRPFLNEAAEQVVVGTYRATPYAPPQIFYAHRDYAHEAARIAIADSVHLDHRGFPMLIEMADNMCRTYFGAQSLERPAFSAFGSTDAPFRHLSERSTRI